MASQPKPLVRAEPQFDRAELCDSDRQEFQIAVANLLEKLQRVVADARSYDKDEALTTQWSIERTKTLILTTSDRVKIPMGSVVPMDGGIQIVWRFNNRHVHLFCARGQSEKSYIYKATTNGGRVAESELMEVEAVNLANELQWIQQS